MESEPQRELTYGEKAVGLSFNPSGDETVTRVVKTLYANLIDLLDGLKKEALEGDEFEKVRLCAIAITEAQGAQMWAVKAITWK